MRLLKFEDFPVLLKEIPDPPSSLYIIGDLPKEDCKYLCVVGSRRNSSYGTEACQKLIEGLRGYPIIIVSGLALGIDTIAHKAALESGLITIAIPGSGLDDLVIYPRSNYQLSKKIVENGGCILSEFEPEIPGFPTNFPQRNRIMAGMSHATLVIEAGERSGTLITSKLATEYNRDVFTVPGSIFSQNSFGPHMLIRLGATPITCSQDILTALGFGPQKLFQGKKIDPSRYNDCTKEELIVIELLKRPMSKSDLVRKLTEAMPISQANMLISLLEIKNLIKESLSEFHLT